MMPVNAALEPVNNGKIDRVKVVLDRVLLVNYPPSFYRDMVQGKVSAFVALVKDRTVGCVAWISEAGLVNVLALCVLATEKRERGVATQLLERCLLGATGAYLCMYRHIIQRL